MSRGADEQQHFNPVHCLNPPRHNWKSCGGSNVPGQGNIIKDFV